MKKLLLILMFSQTASAASLYCTGEVVNTHIDKSGDLYIKGAWRNDYTRLCNLGGTVNNIDSITCSMWGSFVTTALKDKKKVTVSFDNNSGVTCATLPTYTSTPPVKYVMLRKEDVL